MKCNPIDEAQALRIAIESNRQNGRDRHTGYHIALDGDRWLVSSEDEMIVCVDSNSGELLARHAVLDPVVALTNSREYALRHNLTWKPPFSLELQNDGWKVGSHQRQTIGGGVYILVNRYGEVTGHHINEK